MKLRQALPVSAQHLFSSIVKPTPTCSATCFGLCLIFGISIDAQWESDETLSSRAGVSGKKQASIPQDSTLLRSASGLLLFISTNVSVGIPLNPKPLNPLTLNPKQIRRFSTGKHVKSQTGLHQDQRAVLECCQILSTVM